MFSNMPTYVHLDDEESQNSGLGWWERSRGALLMVLVFLFVAWMFVHDPKPEPPVYDSDAAIRAMPTKRAGEQAEHGTFEMKGKPTSQPVLAEGKK